LKFILDNNLSKYLARALAALCEPDGVTVTHLADKFSGNPLDIDWIQALAEEDGWVIISHDRFHKNPLEKEALRRAGLTVFVLKKGWASQRNWEKAAQLIRWWPRIMEQADLVSGGAVFEVQYRFSGRGRFQQVQI
jgi:hypothetical protein